MLRKHPNAYIMWIPEGEERKGRITFENIIAETHKFEEKHTH